MIHASELLAELRILIVAALSDSPRPKYATTRSAGTELSNDRSGMRAAPPSAMANSRNKQDLIPLPSTENLIQHSCEEHNLRCRAGGIYLFGNTNNLGGKMIVQNVLL